VSECDLLISDLGLPETDGCTLLRQIRELEAGSQLPPVPAVALTAFAREKDRTAALEAGFQSYLSKPIDPEQLLNVLHHLAAGKNSGGGALK